MALIMNTITHKMKQIHSLIKAVMMIVIMIIYKRRCTMLIKKIQNLYSKRDNEFLTKRGSHPFLNMNSNFHAAF